MMRWAAVAAIVVVVATGGYAAGTACQSSGAGQQQPAATGDAEEPADNLAAVVRGDALRERLEIMQQWGFSLQDLQLIRAYKGRMHALKSQLQDALQNLAVVMYTRYEDPEQRLEAARKALEKCQQIQREDERLQHELIERLGAKDDPVKMAGLILLGVVGGGRRTLCEVRPGVAGGAQPTGSLGGLQLRQTLGPPRPLRRPPLWWWLGRRGGQQPAQAQQQQ